jgi:hypothetical protein
MLNKFDVFGFNLGLKLNFFTLNRQNFINFLIIKDKKDESKNIYNEAKKSVHIPSIFKVTIKIFNL